MTDHTQRALELFAEAIEHPEAQRAAFLDDACGADHALREQVERLIRDWSDVPDNFLGGDAPPTVSATAPVPERIGDFRIIRVLGQGGMGIVYEAEQGFPSRRVALKVIRPWTLTDNQIKRFRFETQVLAQLQHPGIAPMYEAGVAKTEFGEQPYFVMELVQGPPLDRYARERNLDNRARVELTALICDAVSAAHQRGVVHRDLKPANILVVPPASATASVGQPKILDFGIARVAEAADQRSLQTEVGQLVGTLSYMSPEQITSASGDLDARSDIYTIGVILYELLTGRLPYDLRDRSVPDAASVICNEEPSRIGRSDTQISRDLATIVAKAMEKDPDRRYPTAAALAADLRRFLADEPIVARAPSRLYLFRKFARRHRQVVAGVSATFLALLIGSAAALHYAYRANRNAALAHERESTAVFESYCASISAAGAALRERDIATARALLGHIPESTRGWEWRYLNAQLDQSTASVDVSIEGAPPGGPFAAIATAPDGDTITLIQRTRRSPEVLVSTRNASDLEPIAGWSIGDRYSTLILPERNEIALCDNQHRMVFHRLDTGAIIEHGGQGASAASESAARDDLAPLVDPLRRHAESEFREPGARAVLSPDNRRAVILLPKFSQIRVFDTTTEQAVELPHPEGASDAVFTPDSARLVTAGRDRQLRIFDVEDLTSPVLAIPDAHEDAITSIAISSDGGLIASGSEDRSIRLWRTSDASLVGRLVGHDQPIRALAFSADDRSLYSTDSETLRRWGLEAAGDLAELTGHRSAVRAVAVSPDGALLATGGDDVRLWDIPSRTLIAILRVNEPGIPTRGLRFSGDGRTLYASRRGDTDNANAIDLRTGVQTEFSGGAFLPDGFEGVHFVERAGPFLAFSLMDDRETTLYKDGIARHTWSSMVGRCMAFSPDNRILATGDREIALLDTRTGERIATLTGHTSTIHTLAFLPDGSRLISGSDDRTIRIWDIEREAEVARLRGHLDRVNDIALTPDGSTLFSASGDLTARVWDTHPTRDVLRARAEREAIIGAITPEVDSALASDPDTASVADRFDHDDSFSERQRQIARQLILIRALRATD